MEEKNFREKLEEKMNNYVHQIYNVTKKFPKEEMFGSTSQLKRAALSVILNFIEGYARRTNNNKNVYRNFLNISYGSLKESKYLIKFSFDENFLEENNYRELSDLADEIGAMLYCTKGFIKE
jgi:four helix bundle protein